MSRDRIQERLVPVSHVSTRNPLLWLILLMLLLPTAHADGEHDEEDDDDATVLGLDAEGLGEAAKVLLIATLAIVVWRPAFKWLRKNGADLFNQEPRPFKQRLSKVNRWYMRAHNWVGFGAALLGTVHGWVLEWHWTLWVGTGAMWVVVLSGAAMTWGKSPRFVKRNARLLHISRSLSIVAVVLLLIGHGLVD